MNQKELKNRIHGCLFGLAVGDALGAPLEFRKRDQLPLVSEMIGGGKFQLDPGHHTDDTSMALCLAASLIEQNGFDPHDQLERYHRWLMDGYMSSAGRSIGAGQNTLSSIRHWKTTGSPIAPYSERSAGNGSLMRLAPVVIHHFNPLGSKDSICFAEASSLTTHNHPLAADTCRWFAHAIHKALQGHSKVDVLKHDFPGDLHTDLHEVVTGGYKTKGRNDIASTGFVLDTLESVLWAFHHTNSFEDGMILAVNLAGDADTVGAVYGQLAGAHYGLNAIPERWVDTLCAKDVIVGIAEEMANRCLDRLD